MKGPSVNNNPRTNNIINALLFQITWFSCVIGSANQYPWLGLACCLLFMTWQLAPQRRQHGDITLVIVSTILGFGIDTLWIEFGFFSFAQHWPSPNVAPAWIILLWVSFSLTINHSWNWLKKHPLFPALIGLIGAPLSYLGGQSLGAINFQTDPLLVCSILGIVWALALSLLYQISLKFHPNYNHS